MTKAQRLAAGGWNVVPAVLLSSGLSDGAIRLYAALDGFVRSSKDDFCSPGLQELAKACNKSERSIRRHAQELESAEVIAIKKNGNTGRNVYYFLEVKGDTNRTDLAGCPDTNRTDLAGTNRTDLAGCSEGILIKGESKPSDKNAANQQTANRCNRKGSDPTIENLAAAFLTMHFDMKTAEKLLWRHGAAKVLHVKRQLAVRETAPENPPGLIRYALKQPIKAREAIAVANEILHAELQEQLRAEVGQHKGQRKIECSFKAWLEQQLDKDEIIKRAEADVNFRTKGIFADRQTKRHMIEGFLRRLRSQRDRAGPKIPTKIFQNIG